MGKGRTTRAQTETQTSQQHTFIRSGIRNSGPKPTQK